MNSVSTAWTTLDYFGALRARLGFWRDQYSVEPGLYAVGNPSPSSPVMVSANYKLSFDLLRKELNGLDAYILVLDTKGVNVWCSSGKGTFSTAQVVKMVGLTRLSTVVTHKNLILPQLSATGVMAHVVKTLTGFKVIYGPVRAKDIPAFLELGMKATPAMRRMDFLLMDRLAVAWTEVVHSIPYLLFGFALMILLAGRGLGYSLRFGLGSWSTLLAPFLIAWIGGSLFVPIFLPYLPGRPFSTKGAIMGALLMLIYLLTQWQGDAVLGQKIEWVALFVTMTAFTSFIAMNFTGSSTYTSLSGVKKEMKFAIPSQIAVAVVGLALWTMSRIY